NGSAGSNVTTAGSTSTSSGPGTDTTSTGAGGATSQTSATSVGGPGGASATTSSSGGEPGLRFVGRVDRSDAGGERFAWSGSGLVAAFEGTQVSVSLNDASENQFTVVLDGEVLPKLAAQSGSHDYLLADALAPGAHVLELYRRTEASFGVTQLLGLDFGADGQLLAPPAAPDRLIEIVGDSITCGYGNEGPDTSCGFSADTENHYLTYGALAARELGADVSTVAWSGKGIIYNYGDDKADPLPALYDRTLPGDAASVYDFAQPPDAVVINLGTNDFSTDGDPTPDVFQTAYTDLLMRIRDKYPDAFLLCTVGPLLTGDDLTAARTDIEAAVATLQNQGDLRVKSWEMNISNDAPGCDWHPSLATHEAMATALVSELRANLGW
ncbi:MAG TPA: SGNH/GDSL hydrolase family protein, partial [Polyangiaceae bacterium]|nr:SGNH/GDSL hydrolase family protein [Polyangiaceae bacterium]